MRKKIKVRSMQLRAADDADGENLHVEGYALVFNQKTLLWESPYSGTKYYEVIAPGAVDANTDMSDVILRYNHSDSALILPGLPTEPCVSMWMRRDSRSMRILRLPRQEGTFIS